HGMSAPQSASKVCSRLSPHISFGTLSVREVEKAVVERRAQLGPQDQMFKRSLSSFSSRLVWRCHFMQKLEDQPDLDRVCMHHGFEGLREPFHNSEFLQAWCQGQTGYPFVDACMRSLNQSGWLNFRMRAMLVSFAAYHLWLDWRQFGPHLARQFTDYEPGIHYSQLQMQSGVTGINTLRIYNPVKQSYDQDPEGKFIRKWVPELADVNLQWLHEPWKMSSELNHHAASPLGKHYPFPLVINETAMKQARARMRDARRVDGFADIARQVYARLGSRNRPVRKHTKAQDRQLSLFR
ncbi:MAG: FAD-binding domain-containing protein, partial [Pseudomonadota bacterium]|nr:FAD-binding domain-containing protein [Pseudomonadota bacterium]